MKPLNEPTLDGAVVWAGKLVDYVQEQAVSR